MTAEPTRLHPRAGVSIDHNDIRWRVSNTWKKGDAKMGMLVGYIDARTCMEALDTLDPQWSAVHGDPIIIANELIGVPCALTVNGVTRSDVGMPSSQDPIKGAYSDALKRAAVHFDIGRELYELPKIAVECEVGNDGKVKAPKATPVFRNGRWEIDRKYGWVRYDRDPDDQPEPRSRGERPHAPQSHAGAVTSAPAPRTKGEALGRLAEVAHDHNLTFAAIDRIAEGMGISRTGGSVEDIVRLIAAIEQPGQAEAAPDAPPAPAEQSEDRAHASDVGEGSADGPSPDIETPQGGSGPAATPEAGGSPPAAPPPAAPSSFSDPASFEVYGAAVLGREEPQSLKDWTPAEWDQVFASLGLSEPTAFQSWYTSLERPVRAALMTAHQSPTARREAAKAAAKGKPDAEALRMGLES